jgi:hypothetical protein
MGEVRSDFDGEWLCGSVDKSTIIVMKCICEFGAYLFDNCNANAYDNLTLVLMGCICKNC